MQKNLASVGLGLALGVMALIAGVSYLSTRGFAERAERVEHTHEVLYRISSLLQALTDAETGQRGYIITGDEKYLAPYDRGIAAVDEGVQALKRLTADNPAQQSRVGELEALVAEHLAALNTGVLTKRREPVSSAAAEFVRTDRGKNAMDRIRALAREMKAEEERLLAQRSRESGDSARFTVAVVLLGNAAAVAALLAAFGFLRREIRLRREVEVKLREHARIVDLANVMIRDPQDRIVHWNTGMERLYGWTREEALGQVSHSLFQTLFPEPLERIRATLARQGRWEGELTQTTRDGRRLVVASHWLLHRAGAGKPAAVLEIDTDISDRKLAEERIRALNRDLETRAVQLEAANKELESFSYSVSHDLRSPLRAIDGFSRMLEEDYAGTLDEEGRRLLRVIRDNSRSMGQLIDDLLAFSRLGRKPIEASKVDMAALAEEAFREAAPPSGAPRVRWVAEPIPEAWGDSALLRQVWVNLLSNAFKFSSRRDEPVIEVGGRPNGEDNLYYVKDNGAGFDMQYYNKLFGVFQRLHRQEEFSGTGVGLAIVQRVVSRHGGRVWAEGAPDQGATFYFTLPAKGEHHD